MQDTQITLVGNLTDRPELRFTASGVPVCNFTVAVTPRTFDKQSQQWVDGTTAFHKATAWRQLAQALAELEKGTRVIVQGNLEQENYVSKEGDKRSTWKVVVSAGGPELSFATKAQAAPVQQVSLREALHIPPNAYYDENTRQWVVPQGR